VAITEDKKRRSESTEGAGTLYHRVYYGPLQPAALASLLPAVGGSMPSGSDCPADTKVIAVGPAHQASGRAVAEVLITGFHHGTGAMA